METRKWAPVRLGKLAATAVAGVRFVSCEPLLGELNIRPRLAGGPRPQPYGCHRWNERGQAGSSSAASGSTRSSWVIVTGAGFPSLLALAVGSARTAMR